MEQEILDWLNNTISGDWKIDPFMVTINPITFEPEPMATAYCFENDADATMFRLKWGK